MAPLALAALARRKHRAGDFGKVRGEGKVSLSLVRCLPIEAFLHLKSLKGEVHQWGYPPAKTLIDANAFGHSLVLLVCFCCFAWLGVLHLHCKICQPTSPVDVDVWFSATRAGVTARKATITASFETEPAVEEEAGEVTGAKPSAPPFPKKRF